MIVDLEFQPLRKVLNLLASVLILFAHFIEPFFRNGHLVLCFALRISVGIGANQ